MKPEDVTDEMDTKVYEQVSVEIMAVLDGLRFVQRKQIIAAAVNAVEAEQNVQCKPTTKRVVDHHVSQFGEVSLAMLAAKLGEESGELCGALIRHIEARDGRHWRAEIGKELRHTLIVLTVIADRM